VNERDAGPIGSGDRRARKQPSAGERQWRRELRRAEARRGRRRFSERRRRRREPRRRQRGQRP
jgi:hypothetical protein